MSNWSMKEILCFLESYQAEPCIWNPIDKDHKDKRKVCDAWNRLSEISKRPVKEIKHKKEILMVTFRKYLKKKHSIHSGSGTDDIYEPTWFAYRLMESFLLPVYTSKICVNSETQSITPVPEVNETENETEEREDYIDLEGPSTSTAAGASIPKKSMEKSRRWPAPRAIAEKQVAKAFSQLTNVLSQRYPPPGEGKEDDECDLYAKLLAKKMRELPTEERKIMMYKIDGLFIKKINWKLFSRETLSPQYIGPYSRPSRPGMANLFE